MTSGLKMERAYYKRKRWRNKQERKYRQEKKEASYEKQKEASDNINKQSTQRWNLQCFRAHYTSTLTRGQWADIGTAIQCQAAL